MAINNKDFRVKNGLQVAGSATVGGSLTVADPTSNNHVATKSYVDSIALPTVSSAAPELPLDGQLWLDSVSGRLHVFDGASWITMATVADAEVLPDHIHDTSIEGNGLIVTLFVDGGSPSTTYYWTTEAGSASTTDWADTWSGGISVDNWN
jgi:hypothetical protein